MAADAGDGNYTLSSLPDTDRDGAPNCHGQLSRGRESLSDGLEQERQGRRRDRASRTAITRLAVRGHVITVTGDMLPRNASASAWFVEVRRAGKVVARTHGSGGKGSGRAVAVLRVPASVHGKVQVRALLTDRRFNRATSKAVVATLK